MVGGKTQKMNLVKDYKQYFTPDKLAAYMVSIIPDDTIEAVVDLSMGECGLLEEAKKRWSNAELYGADIDKELINLFKMIKYHSPEIERLLGYEFSRRDIFEEYKNYNINYLTEIHRAIRFLYLITQSFVGKGKTYGYGTTTKPSQKVFYKNMLSDIRERLSNTYVENLSFEKIIDKYDRDIAFSFVILRILKLQDMIISLEKKNISF